jgi:hypothetical protein
MLRKPIFPEVNGHRTSYCSIELGIAGQPPISGVKSISYDENPEVGKMFGTNVKPTGRTRGKVDFEGSIEFYQRDWRNLMPILSMGGLFGFSEVAFPLTVIYAEEHSPQDLVADELVGVRFLGPKNNHSEGGADALVVSVTLNIMDILHSGFQGLKTFL